MCFLRVLGIDPGYAIVGYGILDYDGYKFSTVSYGAITTSSKDVFSKRINTIYNDMQTLIKTFKPEALAIERLYFNTNTTTAIDVAQARGVILLACEQGGLFINEYTPLQVKQAITGYGKAEKHQVMEMVKSFLSLNSIPKPDDTADALALAICHAHCSGNLYGKISKEVKVK